MSVPLVLIERPSRPVRPHDRMDLARVDREREALEDRLTADGGVEVMDLEHGLATQFNF